MNMNMNQSQGYNLDIIEECSAEFMGITPQEVTECDIFLQAVRASSMLCFWTDRKLRMSTVEIAGGIKLELVGNIMLNYPSVWL